MAKPVWIVWTNLSAILKQDYLKQHQPHHLLSGNALESMSHNLYTSSSSSASTSHSQKLSERISMPCSLAITIEVANNSLARLVKSVNWSGYDASCSISTYKRCKETTTLPIGRDFGGWLINRFCHQLQNFFAPRRLSSQDYVISVAW